MALLFFFGFQPSLFAEEAHPILILRIKGAVDPAIVRYVTRGLEEARRSQAPALVLELDTPGGLAGSMRKIIQAVTDSPVPVIAYIVPSGAGGAGIAAAAPIAARAPEEVKDLEDLLSRAQGRQVKTIFGVTTLSLQGKPQRAFELSFMESVLHRLARPNLAYLLLLIGIYGLIYELAAPGAILPGILGTVFLVPALVALETLEVSWVGVALIGLSLIFFIPAVKFPVRGVLAAGGILFFVSGSALLFPGIRIAPLTLPWSTIGAATLLTAAFFLGIVRTGVRARRGKG